MESARHLHAGNMTVDELLFPSGFCSSKHKILDSPGVALGWDPEELAEKRSVPRRVVVYVFMQKFIDPREVKKNGDAEVGSDVSERLSRDVEERCSTL